MGIPNKTETDSYFKERTSWTMGILKGYVVALKNMRENTQIHHDKFGNGM